MQDGRGNKTDLTGKIRQSPKKEEKDNHSGEWPAVPKINRSTGKQPRLLATGEVGIPVVEWVGEAGENRMGSGEELGHAIIEQPRPGQGSQSRQSSRQGQFNGARVFWGNLVGVSQYLVVLDPMSIGDDGR